MHRWHARRLVRSARHGVAVNTGWGKGPGAGSPVHTSPGGGRRGSMPTSLAPACQVNLGCVFICSTVLGLQECFSYSRVSHLPRFLGVPGVVSSVYIPPTAASRDAAFCGESYFTRRASVIKHLVPNSDLVPQIQPFHDPPPPATCRRCRWRTNFPL